MYTLQKQQHLLIFFVIAISPCFQMRKAIAYSSNYCADIFTPCRNPCTKFLPTTKSCLTVWQCLSLLKGHCHGGRTWKNQADFFKFRSWAPGVISMLELFSASLQWHCNFYQNWTSICRFPLLYMYVFEILNFWRDAPDNASLKLRVFFTIQ